MGDLWQKAFSVPLNNLSSVCSWYFSLNLCMLGNYLYFLSSAYFVKVCVLKKSVRNTFMVSNGSDPDQDLNSVGPDLGPNCL